jgi:hypothetical protein
VRQSIYKAALAVVIPVLIFVSATAEARISTHNTGARSGSVRLLSSSTTVDPVAQMNVYGMKVRRQEGRKFRRIQLQLAHERMERAKRRHLRELRARAAAQAAVARNAGSSYAVGATSSGSAPGAALAAIARCESGGDPHAVGGGGQFRGKYQFTYATWASVGGSGDPATAPEAEQDRRAAALYASAGSGQWPVCGR